MQMNRKNIILLIVACAVLYGVFVTIQPDYRDTADKLQVAFFNDSLADKVAKIEITQGQEIVSIEVKDNKWTLPSRSNYPADAGKVNSFLLKFFGSSLSQLVTKNIDKYEKFGLTDEAVKTGKTKVVFFGGDGAELGKAYLGERRKGKAQQPDAANMPFGGMDVMMANNGGQYVRREGLEGVYIAQEPISVQLTPIGWIEPSVVNVIAATATAVEQFTVESGNVTKEYLLKRKSLSSVAKSANGESVDEVGEFILEGSAEDIAKVQKSAVSLVETGLQNLRIEDVFGVESEQAKALNFNMRTLYNLSNGLRYVVDSAELSKDGTKKVYVKIAVEFDEATASAQKARYDEAKVAYVKALEEWEAKKKAVDQLAKTDSSSSTSSSLGASDSSQAQLPPKPQEPKTLLLANPEDALKQSSKHKGWVYELPDYVGKKFRQSRSVLFTPEKTDEAGVEQEQHDAMSLSQSMGGVGDVSGM